MFAELWNVTSDYIIGKDKEFAILTIEIWSQIANEDKERTGGSV